MWAAAALEPLLATAEEVGHFLLQRTPLQTWNAWQFPEIAELRAVRFSHLSKANQESTVGVLLFSAGANQTRSAVIDASASLCAS
jgi:hypothetical protein